MISRSPVGGVRPRRVETTVAVELVPGLPATEMTERIAAAGRRGDLGARECAYYLVEMSDRGAHQEFGFRSVIQYAEARHRMARATVHEHLRVGRALETLPLIDGALCEGRLSWSQVRLLVRIATPETESAWVEWSRKRTVREIAAHARNREKGQLPTDPARRHIHTAKFRIQGRVNVAGLELWKTARARLQAETGAVVTDTDMILHAARMILDGTGAGDNGTSVNSSHFSVIVHHVDANGATLVQTDEGPVKLDAETARAVLREAGRNELAEAVPDDEPVDEADENTGPVVPPEERDRPTPAKMLRRVRLRDGNRCRCCGTMLNKSGHHKKELARGEEREPRVHSRQA